MPNVYKFNLEQADFPYEQEDYGTTFRFCIIYCTRLWNLYYPLDANEPDYDETGQPLLSPNSNSLTPAYLPYLNFGFIYETQDQYPGGGLTVQVDLLERLRLLKITHLHLTFTLFLLEKYSRNLLRSGSVLVNSSR